MRGKHGRYESEVVPNDEKPSGDKHQDKLVNASAYSAKDVVGRPVHASNDVISASGQGAVSDHVVAPAYTAALDATYNKPKPKRTGFKIKCNSKDS